MDKRDGSREMQERPRRRLNIAELTSVMVLVAHTSIAGQESKPTVVWRNRPVTKIGVMGGPTVSTVNVVPNEAARAAKRHAGWEAGLSVFRETNRRIEFGVDLLGGIKGVTELLGSSARPEEYRFGFVEAPVSARLNVANSASRRGVIILGGVAVGRRFHSTGELDQQTQEFSDATYLDALTGVEIDHNRLSIAGRYQQGLTKFGPASSGQGPKHFRTVLLLMGFLLK